MPDMPQDFQACWFIIQAWAIGGGVSICEQKFFTEKKQQKCLMKKEKYLKNLI